MTVLGLFLLHIGFIVGVFVLCLTVGTLIFYFRKEQSSLVGCGARFTQRNSDNSSAFILTASEKAACEQTRATKRIAI